MSAVVYLVFEIEHSFYLWDDRGGSKGTGSYQGTNVEQKITA